MLVRCVLLLFFFFKQKTAYEMRISDWSSDVCSSDLGPIALIDEAVPVIVLAPSGPLFEKTVSNMQEVMARGGKIVLISDAEGLAEAGEGSMATIEIPRVHPLIAPLVYRSEEHTSELQSLMRISYAVFCLKKKKYTTQNKTSTPKIQIL